MMLRKIRLGLGSAAVFCLTAVAATGMAPQSVVAPNAKLEKWATGFTFTEGPAVDARGNVFFTDQPNDRIVQWSADGTLSVFMQPCGRSNGLCFDRNGNLWACADDQNQLWCITPKKNEASENSVRVVLKSDPNNKLLNGPNDLWIRPTGGGLYFTDPLYKRPYWKRDPTMQPKGQYVYYLSDDQKTLKTVVTDLKQPNGIIGTPDGKTLYIADIGADKTYAYSIGADGSLSNKRLFYAMGSDGMTIDDAGNVYLTGKGVTVVDKAGNFVENIPVPEAWTGNVCFGGKDQMTLFITASTGLYTIRTRTHGVGSQ